MPRGFPCGRPARSSGMPAKRPVYRQLVDRLRKQAAALEPGAKFPTEREVSERHGISRPTANKVLSALVAEGTLEFRKGLGTFVAERALTYDLRHLLSFDAQARAAGRQPSTRVVSCLAGRCAATEDRLGLAAGAQVWRLVRLRLIDGQPCIVEHRSVPVARCPDLDRQPLEGSIYELFTAQYGFRLAGADQLVSAIAVDADDAHLLGLPCGAPALEARATGLLADGAALWQERTVYHPGVWRFRVQLGGLPGSSGRGLVPVG
jgi:GntR family transcriptional regulator